MEGVPEQFECETDRARFRHFAALEGVELYHAHISRYAFQPHTHEAFGIGAIERGAERFRYRGAQHVAGQSSLVLMNPDELHTGEAATEEGWQYRMIYLQPAFFAQLTDEPDWWFRDVVCHDPLRSQHLLQIQQRLWQTTDTLEAQGLLYQIVELCRPLAQMAKPSVVAEPHRFDKVKAYLHAHYAEPLTLNALAEVANLTPWHFLRQFKAHYHVTPHQMVMAWRMHQAKQMMDNGLPLAHIAAATGMTDQAHFTRAFVQRYGITPGRYQKQVRGQ
ncbi:AraC family transcriptional regulator [Enterobacterales bacterium CwR94]|nr:AraC family transcriptional regulator [Enterobacterales bacterium CwR94]